MYYTLIRLEGRYEWPDVNFKTQTGAEAYLQARAAEFKALAAESKGGEEDTICFVIYEKYNNPDRAVLTAHYNPFYNEWTCHLDRKVPWHPSLIIAKIALRN